MPAQDLDAILEKVDAKDTKEALGIGEALIKGGAATVRELVKRVTNEFGAEDGVRPKYALHGLVIHASRPGADRERGIVAGTLAGELEAVHSDELKAFIARQLQLCGRVQEAPALAKLLSHERLCESGAQALLAIGGAAALDALKAALPGAEGRRQATLRQAVNILSGK